MDYRHAADRQKFICQAQSVNVFVPADVEYKRTARYTYVSLGKEN